MTNLEICYSEVGLNMNNIIYYYTVFVYFELNYKFVNFFNNLSLLIYISFSHII